jgi:uncharacterized protein (AIM24 family)
MSLITRLKLAISALNRFTITTPQPQGDGFDVLLTQSEDAIITQSEIFIVRQTVQYDVLTQDGFMLVTQDGRILQAGF